METNQHLYYFNKPADGEIAGFLNDRLRRSPRSHGLFPDLHEDMLGNIEIRFFARQENGQYIPHATELIAKGQPRQSVLVASPEGRSIIRQNPGFLRKIADGEREGREIGEGWEGKVHEESVLMLSGGEILRKPVAVKYYFPMILREHESSYDAVLYGVHTPGIDQMRVLQFLNQHQRTENIFPGVHFVPAYFATLDVSVAPLIPDAANLETELRKGYFINGHDIHNVNISEDDQVMLRTILLQQDEVLQSKYGYVDPEKRFTKVFSNAAYNIIRGITKWLNAHKDELVAEGLVVSTPRTISFNDATQRNIIISLPAFKDLYRRWAEDPSIAENWIGKSRVPLDDPLLQDPFLYMVRQTAYVIEAMVTGGVVGRVGDDNY